ncbi:MAG: hypothetical protein AAFY88_09275, partial [Acidobacteriota bacterium]
MPDAPRRSVSLFFRGFRWLPWVLLVALVAPAAGARGDASAKKALTFVDLMKFRTVGSPVLSDDGSTVAYEQNPDRGDGEVVVVRVGGDERRIPLGASPSLSADGAWALVKVMPSLEAAETAEGDPPESGAAVLNMATGELKEFESVDRAALSQYGPFVALLHTEKARDAEGDEDGEGEAEAEAEEHEAEEQESSEPGASEGGEVAGSAEGVEGAEAPGEEAEEASGESGDAEASEDEEVEERLGTPMVLVDLETGAETRIEHVTAFAFSETSPHVAYAVAAPGGENGLFVQRLGGDAAEALAVVTAGRGHYTALTWNRAPLDAESEVETLLAFVAAVDDEEGEPGDGAVWIWPASSGEGRAVASADTAPAGSMIPSVNKLHWSLDGQRLFYGTKPRPTPDRERPEKEGFDPYDVEALLDDTGVDVWHVDDPLIKTNERAQWSSQDKDRTYLAVYHRDSASNVPLADLEVREVAPVDNARGLLGFADVPYLRERTWAGFFGDLYWISLEDGDRRQIAERLPTSGVGGGSHLSPDGRYAVYFRAPHWFLFDAEDGSARNLTASLDVSFADEDHDYPQAASSHGLGGWLDDSSAVL